MATSLSAASISTISPDGMVFSSVAIKSSDNDI